MKNSYFEIPDHLFLEYAQVGSTLTCNNFLIRVDFHETKDNAKERHQFLLSQGFEWLSKEYAFYEEVFMCYRHKADNVNLTLTADKRYMDFVVSRSFLNTQAIDETYSSLEKGNNTGLREMNNTKRTIRAFECVESTVNSPRPAVCGEYIQLANEKSMIEQTTAGFYTEDHTIWKDVSEDIENELSLEIEKSHEEYVALKQYYEAKLKTKDETIQHLANAINNLIREI